MGEGIHFTALRTGLANLNLRARMLSLPTLDVVDDYWAGYLGVPRKGLRPVEPRVVAHGAGLADYAGMYAQSFDAAAPVVSLPAAVLERFGAAGGAAAGGLVDDGRWSRVFGDALERVVGPAQILYAHAGTLRPAPGDARVRLLDHADRAALERLRRAVDTTEWEHGGSIDVGAHPVAGVFADDDVAAVAGYTVWAGRIANLGVVTHPAHRGRGLGASVVERVAREALDAGLVPQYRALASNAASLRIAERLGFVPYARSLAVRLRLAGVQ